MAASPGKNGSFQRAIPLEIPLPQSRIIKSKQLFRYWRIAWGCIPIPFPPQALWSLGWQGKVSNWLQLTEGLRLIAHQDHPSFIANGSCATRPQARPGNPCCLTLPASDLAFCFSQHWEGTAWAQAGSALHCLGSDRGLPDPSLAGASSLEGSLRAAQPHRCTRPPPQILFSQSESGYLPSTLPSCTPTLTSHRVAAISEPSGCP